MLLAKLLPMLLPDPIPALQTSMAELGETRLFGAVELGGSKALCAIGSSSSVLAEARIPTTTPDETLALVGAFFAPHRQRLAALGVASFGPLELDPRSPDFGALLRTPKPGWSGTQLTARLHAGTGAPVFIDTDVNAAARAEQRLGSAQGHDPCVYVTVGTGIGVGVSLDGRPLHGLLHPELGHLRAPALCDFAGACPFHGRCIEGVASASALRARTGREPAELDDADPVWDLSARYLAHLLSACVLSYAPRRIVLGGGVIQRPGLIERTRAHLVCELAGYIPRAELSVTGVSSFVVAAALGQRAGLLGAFLLAQEGLRGHD